MSGGPPGTPSSAQASCAILGLSSGPAEVAGGMSPGASALPYGRQLSPSAGPVPLLGASDQDSAAEGVLSPGGVCLRSVIF